MSLHVALDARLSRDLPMPRVTVYGRHWRRLVGFSAEKGYVAVDFLDEVRERILEPLQYDRVAMWSDPIERLGLTKGRRCQ